MFLLLKLRALETELLCRIFCVISTFCTKHVYDNHFGQLQVPKCVQMPVLLKYKHHLCMMSSFTPRWKEAIRASNKHINARLHIYMTPYMTELDSLSLLICIV